MAGGPIGVLRAELSLNHARFSNDLNSARAAAATGSARIARAFDDMGRSFKRSAERIMDIRGLLAGITVGSIIALSKSSIEAADSIGKTADACGVTTEALQEYRFAADQSGISQDALDSALKTFTKTLGQTRAGTGPLAEALSRLDPNLLKLIRSAGSTDDALKVMFGAMDRVRSASDKAALASAAFGRSAGVEMVNMLRGGVAGLEGMRQQARDLGIVLDDSLIRSAQNTKDQFEILSATMSARFTQAVGVALPSISSMGEALTTSANWIANVISRWSEFIGLIEQSPRTRLPEVERELVMLREKLHDVKTDFQGLWGRPEQQKRIFDISADIGRLEAERKNLEDAIARSRGARPPAAPGGEPSPWTVPTTGTGIQIANQPQALPSTLKEYKDAQEVIESTRTSEERMRLELERIEQIRPKIVAMTGSEAETNRIVAAARKKVTDEYKRTNEVAIQAHRSISSGLADAILQGKSFSETLQQISRDLFRIAVQMGMSQMVGGIFSAARAPVPVAAHGAVVSSGQIQKFGSGGVLRGPTVFPLRNGLGMGGERGEEGLLPLTRVGGDLGVRATIPSSPNITLHQTITVQGTDFSDPSLIRKIMRGIGDEARFGTIDGLSLGGLLGDQASINSRRAR